jgi:CBS domain-containing protein
MPLLLGTKEEDIMKWRACAELAARIKEDFSGKRAGGTLRQAQDLLEKYQASLQQELDYEAQCLQELDSLLQAIAAAGSPAELPLLQDRYRELACAHFSRRQAVLPFCDACNSLHDRLLDKVVSLAIKQLLQNGPGAANWALLVSGERSRGEQTLRARNHYLLLYRQGADPAPLIGALAGALKDAGYLESEQQLWHGTLQDWQVLLEAGRQAGEHKELPLPLPFQVPHAEPQQVNELERRLELMTELRFLQGDAALADQVLQSAEQVLKQARSGEAFFQLARRVLSLPLAVGHFGRWRLQRSLEHRGELDLEELALAPLVMTVRVLAVQAEVAGGGTVARIQALLSRGALDVELAERLLKAYQCFMQLKIRYQVGGRGDGAFCEPGALGEVEELRLRNSVAAVFSLQKIGYQRIVVQG